MEEKKSTKLIDTEKIESTKIIDTEEICTICLLPPRKWCHLYTIPCCKKKFHYNCMRKCSHEENGWANYSDTCPTCRAKLPKFAFQLFLRICKRVECREKCNKDETYYGIKILNIWSTDTCADLWSYVCELLNCPQDMLVFLKTRDQPRLSFDDDDKLCTEKFSNEQTLYTQVRGGCENCHYL